MKKIRENGGGIDAISSYFCDLLRKQPDNLEDITCRMSERLQSIIDPHFVRSVTGMLLAAPYGLSEQIIREIDSQESIGYSRLNMKTFCRAYASLIIETLDGYIRFNDTPAVNILREHFRLEQRHSAETLERYMRVWLEDSAKHEAVLRDQYLQIAFHAGASEALVRYIRAFYKDPTQIAAVLNELMNNGGVSWLKSEMPYLSVEEYFVLIHYVYPLFKLKGLDDSTLNLWESCKESAEKNLSGAESHETLKVIFYLSYQCGEIAFTLKSPKAEGYFLSAKEISRRDFQTYHNKMWRMLHGLPLTEEETAQDKKFFGGIASSEKSGLLYGNELSDMLAGHSWSNIIRSINNYLAIIYKEQGNNKKAAELQKESENLTRLMDPSPKNKGRIEIAPGITLITPEEIRGEKGKKSSYQPDYRRNTAVQIAKQAIALSENGRHKAALEKYKESNEILLEIYQDGEDRKYYRFDGVSEQEMEYIRTECLHDLSINYRLMVKSASTLKMPGGVIIELIEKMLEYGLAFDEARTSKESKINLEDCYISAVAQYFRLSDYIRCLSYCGKYFYCREEAFAKGGKWKQLTYKAFDYVAYLFYQCAISQPDLGSKVTDILLETCRKSAMYKDFDGFRKYSYLASDLLDWTRNNGVNWTSGNASLEGVYVNSICNICHVWLHKNIWDRFEQDALQLENHIDHFLEKDSRLQSLDILSQLGLYYLRQGNYDKAAAVFGHVMESMTLNGSLICPPIILIQRQSNYIAALSEAGSFEEAYRESEKEEAAIYTAMRKGYSEQEKAWKISREDFERTLKKELAALYLNRAITQSRMGKNEQAQMTLAKAESYIKNNPELKTESDLIKRVQLCKERGLPARKIRRK